MYQLAYITNKDIVHTTINGKLNFLKTCSWWIPRTMIWKYKEQRVELLTSFYENGGRNFLTLLLTSDETWIHHYKPQSISSPWNVSILVHQ